MVQLEIGLAMAVEMGRAELLLISGGRSWEDFLMEGSWANGRGS